MGLATLLSACGGGGGSSNGSTGATSSTGSTIPTTTTTTGCSLRERQDWAAAQLREWYLFPEALPTNLNPAAYSSVEDYIDALTATARVQRRDRFFTYLTSISGEDAYYDTGSSAGFGIRLATDATARTVTVTEAFEGAPGLAAGIDRGTQILAIGTSSANLRTVSDIIASTGTAGVTDALGPTTAGTARTLRISDMAGTRVISVAKADYALTPVSSRYGARIINDGGRQIGYVNLRTFITTADPALRNAFAQFRAAGVNDVVVDLRYNGGGLVSIAELLSNLLGANRARSDVIDYLTFRPEKTAENSTTNFAVQAQSVSPTRIAFIGTAATASASELTINAFIPYLHANVALVGSNTYGKPVGQIALDRAACDDRLRVIAFAVQNAAHSNAYFDGLASAVEASCVAADDVSHPFGDPQEASLRAALDFVEGKSCSRIASDEVSPLALGASGRRVLLTPTRPDTAQREVPGLF
jgi:C-terminal processing protease CtpA/Prc